MAPETSSHKPQTDLLRKELVNLINNTHLLPQLAANVDLRARKYRFDS